MNSSGTTIRRAIAATAATAAIVTTAACGTERAPANHISGSHSKQEKKPAPPQPARTSEQRMDFGDEIGTADHREKKPSPAGSGTRNRMDFRDRGF